MNMVRTANATATNPATSPMSTFFLGGAPPGFSTPPSTYPVTEPSPASDTPPSASALHPTSVTHFGPDESFSHSEQPRSTGESLDASLKPATLNRSSPRPATSNSS